MQTVLRILLPIGLLALAWLGFKGLSKKEERQKRPDPPARVIKTRVMSLERVDYRTVVRTQGVVRAHNQSGLTAEVTGKVVEVSDQLQDGGFFSEGDLLVALDDLDYQTAVVTAEAALARASAALAQEQARAKQARLNWEDLGYDEEPNELVLRLPQLREAEANVKAAEAGVDQSKRDLARTKIRAPFSGRVLTKSVAIGQSVGPNTPLAMVFSTEFVEVRLPISASDLQFLTLPEGAGAASVKVTFTDSLQADSGTTWEGRIIGTEGALDESSRELFAIARVDDPFELNKPAAERGRPLRVGQPVGAAIDGQLLSNVVAVPRDAVRQLNRIFLVVPKEDKPEELALKPYDIAPIWSDAEFHVVRDADLADGTRVAMTRLVYGPSEATVEILPDLADPALAEGNGNPEEDS